MTSEVMYVTVALSGLAGVGVVASATLAGWRGWLQLKRSELDYGQAGGTAGPTASGPSAGARIEIADLKERIRKLEAIAAGVDL